MCVCVGLAVGSVGAHDVGLRNACAVFIDFYLMPHEFAVCHVDTHKLTNIYKYVCLYVCAYIQMIVCAHAWTYL